MSLKFFRDFNKNVQESLSILNEGLQITNGLVDIKSTYLPHLLLLRPPKCHTDDERPTCCLFHDVMIANSGLDGKLGAEFARNENSKAESNNIPKGMEKLGYRLSVGGSSNLHVSPVDGPDLTKKICTLGDKCLLKTITSANYSEGIKFIFDFLNKLQRVRENQVTASRNLIEIQSISLLCEISNLIEVVKFIRNGSSRLEDLLGSKDDIVKSLLSIVGLSLKQINEILTYPISLLDLRENSENGRFKLEKRTIDNVMKEVGGRGCYSDYEILGSVNIIHLHDIEKDQLTHYLSLVDSVMVACNNGASLLNALEVCSMEQDPYHNEIIYASLSVLQKIFAYNDLDWHMYQQNSETNLYACDKLDTFHCAWQLLCDGVCYNCRRRMYPSELFDSSFGDFTTEYCDCMIVRNGLDTKNRHFIEENIIQDNGINIKMLLRMLREPWETFIKSKIVGTLLQLMVNSVPFRHIFMDNNGFDAVVDILNKCRTDQFYIIDSSFDSVNPEDHRQSGVISTINTDVIIAMSFLPCSVDCILLLRYCLKRIDCYNINFDALIELIAGYSKSLLAIFSYFNHSELTSKSNVYSVFFSRIIYIALDTCVWLLTQKGPSRDESVDVEYFSKIRNSHFPVIKSIGKIARVQCLKDSNILQKMSDCNLLESVVLSFALLSDTRFGFRVQEYVLDSMLQLITVYLWASNDASIESLRCPIERKFPVIYRLIFNILREREMERTEPESEETNSARLLRRLRLKILENMDESPQIIHLLLCLLDPYISYKVKEPFRHCILGAAVRCGVFEVESSMDLLFDYLKSVCKETIAILGSLDKGSSTLRYNYLRQNSDILVSIIGMLIPISSKDKLKTFKIPFLDEHPWNFVSRIFEVIAPLKVSFPGIENDLASLLLSVSEFFILYTSFLIKNIKTKKDQFNLLQLIDLTTDDKNGGEKLGLFDGLMSTVVAFFSVFWSKKLSTSEEIYNIWLIVKKLDILYTSDEHRKASALLMEVEDITQTDSLVLTFQTTLERFLANIGRVEITNAIGLLYWYRTNILKFTLSPFLHKWIVHFRLLLHSHMVTKIIFRVYSTSYVCGSSTIRNGGDYEQKTTAQGESLDNLKQIHSEEMAFAKYKLAQLNSQLTVLTNSYYLADANIKNLKNSIALIQSENDLLRSHTKNFNDSILDYAALNMQLKSQEQKFQQLELKYNKLLQCLGSQHGEKTEP